jgi:Flp pilus assembly pilin Flp
MMDLLTQVTVRLQSAWSSLRDREDGQTMTEYALLLAGIALIVIVGIALLGPVVRDLFKETASSVVSFPGG